MGRGAADGWAEGWAEERVPGGWWGGGGDGGGGRGAAAMGMEGGERRRWGGGRGAAAMGTAGRRRGWDGWPGQRRVDVGGVRREGVSGGGWGGKLKA